MVPPTLARYYSPAGRPMSEGEGVGGPDNGTFHETVGMLFRDRGPRAVAALLVSCSTAQAGRPRAR
jgi:hypothetical protein